MLLIKGLLNGDETEVIVGRNRNEKHLISDGIIDVTKGYKVTKTENVSFTYIEYTAGFYSDTTLEMIGILNPIFRFSQGDSFEGEISWLEPKVSERELIGSLIKHPFRAGQSIVNTRIYQFVNDYVKKTIEVAFIKKTQEVECFLYMRDIEFEDGNEEERCVRFSLDGREMISEDEIININNVVGVVRSIASVTGKKYTFHRDGMPYLTVSADDIIEWRN